MNLFERFRPPRENNSSARIAKERLQIVITHERAQRGTPGYLPALKEELINVIRKYVQVEDHQVKVQMDHEGDYEVLELNITLPENQVHSAY
ncbi:MAG: cell division topological specificity factor MinE [Gammaproteobacteria bacterium]|nr:cell division topological specificity factor MinE [Gammaproteobacteria bacterium]